MSRWNRFRQGMRQGWQSLRHGMVALAVLLNGLLIFRTIYGMPVDLQDIFHLRTLTGLDLSLLINGPWFMLGVFLVLSTLGLLFRARLAWALSLVLLLITLIYMLRFYPSLHPNAALCLTTMASLLLLRRDFNRSSATAGSIFAFISFASLLFYSSYGALYLGDGFEPPIENLMGAFYFSIETMTTVGYGDILPVSEAARLFTVSVIIAGITVFATSMSTIFGPLISGGLSKLVKGDHKTMQRKDHFIICGHSMLAINTLLQLHERGQPITLIVNLGEEELAQLRQRLGGDYDIMAGDSSDNATLTLAGIGGCKAILALGDNDADNAFVVLAAHDLAPGSKTIVAVNDSKNINKIKKVQPDILLSPQLFGSEVLARVLNGEEIDNQMLISLLLTQGKEAS
ncbi:voltage-gated potassium channel protein [Aeromonas schubertii]|uniref:voltage-gated potassium channel protein n=1 Tax=Aeromonas schubertii TaxID=652 RepID=UPI0010A8B72E|nr:voltage-gated potassium channel protein [Aeromonas schubertii]QCG47304.1 voltage-gated potassium channel protein [Aeromonas schubertii]